MKIQLSDHYNYKKLFIATISPILMMLFTSLYGIVDGFFVSNFVGEAPFAAINLMMPAIMIVGGVGFMFGTGGSALVSMKLGAGQKDEANQIFSNVVVTMLSVGAIISSLLYLLMPKVALWLGATEDMLPYCITYGRIIAIGEIFFMLQNLFQSFFMVAEKPQLGFMVTLFAGCTNMVLDPLFIAGFKWGIAGAAFATVFGEVIGATIPLLFFLNKEKFNIHLVRPTWTPKYMLRVIGNGSSEFFSSIANSIVGILYNLVLIEYLGEYGVISYGVVMYFGFIFAAIFIGYTIGTTPIIGFHYGAENSMELKNLLKRSIVVTTSLGLLMCLIDFTCAPLIAKIFVGYNEELQVLCIHALRINAFCFLFIGSNIFFSSFFTALNNGLISALISIFRTLVCEVSCILILPKIIGDDGIWIAGIIAECLSMVLAYILLICNKKKYQY